MQIDAISIEELDLLWALIFSRNSRSPQPKQIQNPKFRSDILPWLAEHRRTNRKDVGNPELSSRLHKTPGSGTGLLFPCRPTSRAMQRGRFL